MQITFLGTSCMVPTKERNHQAIFLTSDKEGLLFDCGEGTQRQFKLANLKPTKISKIFISHWHGDHVLGLPGLFQTLSNSDYERCLEIYGPKGTKERIETLFSIFVFDNKVDYIVKEVHQGEILSKEDYSVFAFPLEHGTPCLGYRYVEADKRKIQITKAKRLGLPEGPALGKLQQGNAVTVDGKKIKPEDVSYVVKGKIIGFVFDTVLCDSCDRIAKDSDILVCEAVYMSKDAEKAREYGHLTSLQAGQLAARNNVKRLILTHFSQRYKEIDELCQEAKAVHPNTECAYDLMKIKI